MSKCATRSFGYNTRGLSPLSITTRPTEWASVPHLAPVLRRAVVALIGAATVLELILLFGFLQPLSIKRFPEVVPTPEALATALGTDGAGALRFAVPVLGAFAVFTVAVWLATRVSGRVGVLVVLAGTLLFSVTLIPINPLGAHDAYYHVGNARTLWRYGDNPAVMPPITHADDPFFPYVASWDDFPSAYGPVWYVTSGLLLPFVGDGLWLNVLALKAITAASLVAATVLVMLLAERLRSGAAVAAGVLVGWNPLLLWETAGNGHNDVLIAVFALAALYAVSRRWWVAVFPLLALSVLTKYVLVLLGPVLLIGLWRRPEVPRRQLAVSVGLAVLITLAAYAPFFAGRETITSFGREGANPTSSPGALLYALVSRWLAFDRSASAAIMRLVLVPPFLVTYAVLLWRTRRHNTTPALVRTCFWVVFIFLVVVKWWFWPWYLLWVVPLAALLPGSRQALLAAVFSATAMLIYVPYYWFLHGDAFRILVRDALVQQAAIAATGFLVPVLVAVASYWRHMPRLAPRFQRVGKE